MLQALARDGLAPSFLSRVSETGQPVVATWISGAIALAAVAEELGLGSHLLLGKGEAGRRLTRAGDGYLRAPMPPDLPVVL